MKKTLILLCSLLSLNLADAQGCLPDGITFTTQAHIDNFQTNYPGCSEIGGDVTINGGNSINNLTGLSVLATIGGSLSISSNSTLHNLSGLDNLLSVGGNLVISQNAALTNLAACTNLQTVSGSLEIIHNSVLTSLAGLDQLDGGSLNDLVIHDNYALATCNVECVCEYLGSPNGHVDIYNNAQGCRTPPEIANACGFTLSCLPYGDYYILSQSDVDNFKADYSNCTEPAGIVKISGSDITNLNGLNEITSIGFYLTIVQNPLLTSLTGLESMHSVSGAISIGYNPSLTSLMGLGNLSSLDGYLSIYNNNELISLSGLENLTSIGDMLEIISNEKLDSLTALNNLSSIGNSLWVRNNINLTSLSGLDHVDSGSLTSLVVVFNSLLTTCEVESICDYLASPGGSVSIENNAPGCNSPEEVEAACEEVGLKEIPHGKELKIFPNPTCDYLVIETSEAIGIKKLEIINACGRQVFSQPSAGTTQWIDVSNLPKGLYIVKVTGEKSVMFSKFVKE